MKKKAFIEIIQLTLLGILIYFSIAKFFLAKDFSDAIAISKFIRSTFLILILLELFK